MPLVFLGTDFHDTNLTDLEKYSAVAGAVLSSLTPQDSPLEGAVVLSTCNRFEVYYEAESFHESLDYVTENIAEHLGVDAETVNSSLRVLYGDAVPQHLFSVAAGLESMIVGEEEISGQVKRALATSQKAGKASKSLNELFQSASKVSKSVSSTTGLGASGRSIITTAIDIAGEFVDQWSSARVLLIGTGAYSRVVTAALQRLGVEHIEVFSRSGRAKRFADSHNITALTGTALEQAISQADVVVSASGTTGYAVTTEIAHSALTLQKRSRVLPIIDIALSPDVDPELSEHPLITLINLELIRMRAPQEHVDSVTTARHLVHSAVEDFEETLASHSVDPIVAALRAHIGLWVEEEIENVRKKSGDKAAYEVKKSLHRVANAFLHAPSVKAKELAVDGNHEDYIKAVRLLFDIELSDHA